jgi:hypothetical protein
MVDREWITRSALLTVAESIYREIGGVGNRRLKIVALETGQNNQLFIRLRDSGVPIVGAG